MELIKISSEEDISDIFRGMPKNKAPCPDGFAVEFYWEALEVV